MKKNNVPMRRCIGCMESKPKSELTRIALCEGKLTVDRSGRADGRGVYLCSIGCLESAVKKRAFNRSFKMEIQQSEVEKVKGELENEQR